MSPLPSLERLLCELIAVRSVTNDLEECGIALSICRNCLQDLPGVQINDYTEHGHPSLVALSRPADEIDVMLVCHVDVVPAPSSSFAPQVKDGRIIGRGAIDMKGPTSAMIRAFHRHVIRSHTAKDSSSGASVALMITTDEEIGGHDGVRHLISDKGYRARCALLPDAGYDFGLVTLQYGIIRLHVRRRGKTAHSSRPEEGDNAIESFQRTFIDFKKRIGKIPETVSSLAIISGGIALNVVPDLCDAKIDIRTARSEEVLALISEVFDENEYDIMTNEPSLRIDPKHLFIRLYKKVAEEMLKRPVRFEELRGATDARYLSPFNVPVIISSPKGGGHHEDLEWVDSASLEKCEDIAVKFLAEFGKGGKKA